MAQSPKTGEYFMYMSHFNPFALLKWPC